MLSGFLVYQHSGYYSKALIPFLAAVNISTSLKTQAHDSSNALPVADEWCLHVDGCSSLFLKACSQVYWHRSWEADGSHYPLDRRPLFQANLQETANDITQEQQCLYWWQLLTKCDLTDDKGEPSQDVFITVTPSLMLSCRRPICRSSLHFPVRILTGIPVRILTVPLWLCWKSGTHPYSLYCYALLCQEPGINPCHPLGLWQP